MQVALNDAPGGNSFNSRLFPPPADSYYSSLPAHALKNPIQWKREAHPLQLQKFDSQKRFEKNETEPTA
jgi:hypothetical protein